MKKLFLLLLFLYSQGVSAQRPEGGMPDTAILNRLPKIGKITGTVKDGATKKVVDYASVALLKVGDSSIITGVITNDRGEFIMEKLPMGRFILVITSVGYKKFYSKPLLLTPRNPDIIAGDLNVLPSSKQMNEVEVSADKQTLLNTIDKRVIEVGKSLINVGGTATEVLQNVPGVTVDIDGNVSLRGNSNVTVLIDGKPSAITGSSRAAILQQLPAGSIDRIEIITNPGAKYDADGMSGIINIITKKDKMQGFNINTTLGIGTHEKYNASIGINYRVSKINWYGNYNYRGEARNGEGHSERKNEYTINGKDTVYYINNITSSMNNSFSHVVKLGADWYLNNTNTLGFYTTINARKERSSSDIQYLFNNAFGDTNLKTFRQSVSDEKNNSTDFSLDYKHTFINRQELTASSVLSVSKRINATEYLNYNGNIYDDILGNLFLSQYNNTDADYKVLTSQADFAMPIKENGKLETGIKSINRYIINYVDASNYNTLKNILENDTFLTQHYNYEEHIQSAYIQYSGSINKITYQFGMRGEIASIEGQSLLSNIPFRYQYPGLYPSALGKYTFRKTNDFQLSYSRRVNRPEVRALLPIKNYEDAYNYMIGNPELKPESINSFEFSYYKTIKQQSIGTTFYYRHTLNLITRLRTLDTLNGIATTTHRNFSTSDNTGLEIVIKNTIRKAIQITTSANVYQNIVNGSNIDATLQSSAINWNVRTMIAGRLSKTLSFQLSGMYMAPITLPQGKFQGMSGVDLGGKYDFWGTHASITLNVSDVFNSRHFELYNFGDGFTSTNYRKRETRIVMLAFTYRFGNTETTPRKKNKQDQGEQRMEEF